MSIPPESSSISFTFLNILIQRKLVYPFFYHLLCMPSHETASSSAGCGNRRPPDNREIGQWLTTIVCRGFPAMHDGSEAWCHRTRLAAHQPRPVRNLFNVDHRRRLRRMVETRRTDGWVSDEWLVDNSCIEPCINPLRCSCCIWCWFI